MIYVNINVVIRVRKLSETGSFRVIILDKLTLMPGSSKDAVKFNPGIYQGFLL